MVTGVRYRAFRRSLILFVLFATFTNMLTAFADTTNKQDSAYRGITISPTEKELVVSSGLIETTTNVILTNNTDKSIVGTVKLLDFKTLNETSGLLFGQAGVPSSRYGLANWMSLESSETINVLSGQKATIAVRIVNRQDLAPGGHYGAVVVTFSTAGKANDAQANFKQELVSLLLVKKLGGENYAMRLESMKLDGGKEVPEAVIFRFKSIGNVHVVPRGYVTLSDSKGTVIAKGIINTNSTYILPGTSRQLVSLLQPIEHKRTVGRLKVTAYYRHDEQKNFETRTIYLSLFRGALPRVLAVIIIVAILFIIRRYITRKRRSKFKASSRT